MPHSGAKSDARSEVPNHANSAAPDPPSDGDAHEAEPAPATTRRATAVRLFSRLVEAIRKDDNDAVVQ